MASLGEVLTLVSVPLVQVPDPHTVVTINHLKSYEHMGQAGVLLHLKTRILHI